MKKLTYHGKIYTVEDETLNQVRLTGIGWVEKKETANLLTGLFYLLFNIDWKGEIK